MPDVLFVRFLKSNPHIEAGEHRGDFGTPAFASLQLPRWIVGFCEEASGRKERRLLEIGDEKESDKYALQKERTREAGGGSKVHEANHDSPSQNRHQHQRANETRINGAT